MVPQGQESEENIRQPDPEDTEQVEAAPEFEDEEARDEGGEHEATAAPSDLLEHLSQMMSSLERAWSEALDTEPAAQAREEAADVWQSFVIVYVRWIEWVGQVGRRLGVEKTIDRFPLDNAGLAQLELEPLDPARRYHQLQIASLYAFMNLMDSLKGLRDPTGQRVDLLSGRVVETWWEAGAFSLVRRRAAALARILRKQEACLRELTEQSEEADNLPGEGVYSPLTWMEPLHAAADLVSQGWHAAALPQLLLALRSVLAEASGLSAKELPVPLGPRLAGVPQLAPLETPTSLLEAACRRSGEGKEVNPGVAVSLAEELVGRVQELALNPPSRESLSVLRSAEGA